MTTILEEMLRLSRHLVPRLVEEGRRIGKNPFCVDGMAESMAHQILGYAYPQETYEEYQQRHFDDGQCRQPVTCSWCMARRWEFVE